MRPKFPTVAFVSKEQVRDGIGVGSLGDLGCLVGGYHVDGRRADDAHLAVGSAIEDHLEEDRDVPCGGEQAVTAHNAAHYPVEVILTTPRIVPVRRFQEPGPVAAISETEKPLLSGLYVVQI